jgi:hypothetical protein
MNDEERTGFVTPGRNAVDEAIGLTEDPRPATEADDAGEAKAERGSDHR